MKVKFLMLAILFLAKLSSTHAQDKLLDRKGDEYLVKILEITPDSIVYKPFPDSAQATSYILPKQEVFMITYQNGVKEIFDEASSAVPEKPVLTGAQLYNQGKVDAIKYYKAKGAYWGTFGTTILYPPVGLVAGTIIALTPPARHNLVTPEINMLKEPPYVAGYTQQAKKQKFGKAAAGFGTAMGVYAALLILVVAAFAY